MTSNVDVVDSLMTPLVRDGSVEKLRDGVYSTWHDGVEFVISVQAFNIPRISITIPGHVEQ